MRKVQVGDEVQILTGKDKGKRGIVLNYDSARNRIKVTGVNVLVKHKTGGIITEEGTIHMSNVLPYDSKAKKPSRVGFKIENGKKVRFLKTNGQVMSRKITAKNKEK